MWYLSSLIIWALDYWTTDYAVQNGGVEANPIAAHFHEIIGVGGYALAILPLILARAAIASSTDQHPVWRIARTAARIFVFIHVLVILNNFYVVVTL
jgi:hypothetical protein